MNRKDFIRSIISGAVLVPALMKGSSVQSEPESLHIEPIPAEKTNGNLAVFDDVKVLVEQGCVDVADTNISCGIIKKIVSTSTVLSMSGIKRSDFLLIDSIIEKNDLKINFIINKSYTGSGHISELNYNHFMDSGECKIYLSGALKFITK